MIFVKTKLRSAFLIFHHFIFSPSSVFYFIVSLGFEKLIIEGMKEFKISNLIFISCISIIYLPLIIIVAILLFCGFTGSCLLSVLLHNKLYKNFIKWVKSRIFDFKELFKSNLFEFSKLHVIFLVVIILVCMSQMGDRLQILFDNLFLRELNYKGDRWLTTLALLFLGLAGWHNYERYKSKTLLSTNWLFALGCTNLVIFLFWIKGSYCYALMCNGIPFLTYINCFVLINFIYLIGTLITAIHVNKIKFVRECPIILNPGKPINQDEINEAYEYKEYIDSIAPIIIDNFDEDVSVSVGISGAWGSGKTTFLHALQKQIKQDKRVARKDRVLIAFKPWFCEKKTDLVQEFFKVYREHMGKRISGFDSDIMEYAKVLTENVDKLKWMNQVMKLCTPVESIQKQFDAITKKLKRYEIPVYIIIDDLDRLDGEEIMEILRLIRITANFPYTQFILAYDKPYIQKAIQKQLDYDDSERFIDKVINTEICLPHFDHLAMGNLLYNELIEYCNDAKDNILNLEEWDSKLSLYSNVYEEAIPRLLPTFRDVHRFINMFKLDYSNFNGAKEVVFRDFFILSVIKYSYPEFYKIMAFEPERLFFIAEKVSMPDEYLQNYIEDKELIEIEFNQSYDTKDVESLVREKKKEIDMQKRGDLLLSLLNELFIYSDENNESMANVTYYNKYFQFKTPNYLLNYVDSISNLSEYNKRYIIQRSNEVVEGEVVRVSFLYYENNKQTPGLVSQLFVFLNELSIVNSKLRSFVISFYGDFLNSQDIKDEDQFKGLSYLLRLPIDWLKFKELISSIIIRKLNSNKESLLNVLMYVDNLSLLRVLWSYRTQGSISNFEDVDEVINCLFKNVLYCKSNDVGVDFKEKNRIFGVILGTDIESKQYESVLQIYKDYIINNPIEYIDNFISKSKSESKYFIEISAISRTLLVLSESEVDSLFEKEKGNNVSNYENSLKLWNWIKKTGKESYSYHDPSHTKTVSQWLEEGMPDMDKYCGNKDR